VIPELSGMSCVTNQNEGNRSGSQSLSVRETNTLLDNPKHGERFKMCSGSLSRFGPQACVFVCVYMHSVCVLRDQ